jgi:hypothetical protein
MRLKTIKDKEYLIKEKFGHLGIEFEILCVR